MAIETAGAAVRYRISATDAHVIEWQTKPGGAWRYMARCKTPAEASRRVMRLGAAALAASAPLLDGDGTPQDVD